MLSFLIGYSEKLIRHKIGVQKKYLQIEVRVPKSLGNPGISNVANLGKPNLNPITLPTHMQQTLGPMCNSPTLHFWTSYKYFGVLIIGLGTFKNFCLRIMVADSLRCLPLISIL